MKKKTKAIAKVETKTYVDVPAEVLSAVVLTGDLSKLTDIQKVQYYNAYCSRIGLDPVTKPFDLITLNGKMTLYATRSCAQQLNKKYKISHEVKSRELIGSVYAVTCRAYMPDGRYQDSIGAVNIEGLKGDQYANALMKADTKSKRRATLDIVGLGILDESEIEDINPSAIAPNSEPVRIEKVEPKKLSWNVTLDSVVPEGDFKGQKVRDLLTKQLEYLIPLCDTDTADKIAIIIEDRLNAGYHDYCSKHKDYKVVEGFDEMPTYEKKKIMSALGFNFK